MIGNPCSNHPSDHFSLAYQVVLGGSEQQSKVSEAVVADKIIEPVANSTDKCPKCGEAKTGGIHDCVNTLKSSLKEARDEKVVLMAEWEEQSKSGAVENKDTQQERDIFSAIGQQYNEANFMADDDDMQEQISSASGGYDAAA